MRGRTVRGVVGAAAVVAALAVSGCSGGGGDSDGGGGKETSSSAAPDGGSSSGAGSDSGSGSDSDSDSGNEAGAGTAKDAEGIWKASTDGKPVVLVVGARQAALTTADGHLCTGTLSGSDQPKLSLKCADGDTERTAGEVESNDGGTMRIAWDAGKKDTFKKSKGDKLPTDLPSGLPTN
ncbi:hypothetical protein ABZY90_11370 [Streptomyces sp. NPDC006422]|uniref:hypothetical protein n=1 Tax=unclassified Streptomyces TaxID=2593676 RepID=UPI0033A4D1A4